MTLLKKLSPKIPVTHFGRVIKGAKNPDKTLPAELPYLSKRGQLLLPKGLLPILVKTSRDISLVEKALVKGRYLGVVQPLKESKGQKCLHQVGCVGRITTFSEDEGGGLYLILKGVRRFVVQDLKAGMLHVDYTPYGDDQVECDKKTAKSRSRLMGMLKGYLNSVHMDVNWNDIATASDESLVISLAMMCPFESNEKQAILESSTIKERIEMITAFIEMSVLKKSPQDWMFH